MTSLSHWPWPNSLALVSAGRAVQVESVLFGTVRTYCHEFGIRNGAVLECLTQDHSGVEIRMPNGSETRVPREYAWFISVQGL